MSVLTTKAARSIIYAGCIGGLLVVNSAVVTAVWNGFVADDQQERRLTLLEGAGITAFAYVVLSAVRYGRRPSAPIFESIHITAHIRQQEQQQQQAQKDTVRTLCSQLTDEQKAALKRELAERCGCKDQHAQVPADKIHSEL